ncbi:hypothetical protein OPV22_032310 [Ensete ventricosum]|uniref:CASP-like protein n=1 Tax=Ensete ventricosum TaxID=4639 RepID=A0AAV8PKN4_ENSVE|nr:hypothetical protein OPV22_032310 [Ensete ventricosum]
MASLYKLLHRPLSTAVTIAITIVLLDHVSSISKQSEPDASPPVVSTLCLKLAAHRTSIFDVSIISLLPVDKKPSARSSFSIASPTILLIPYQYAKLANPQMNDKSPLTLTSS